MLISYNYTTTTAGTQNFTIPSTLIGSTISFGLNLSVIDPTTNALTTLQLFNCVAEKFAIGTKLEDFVMPEFDYMSYANSAGVVGQWSVPDNF